MPTSLWCQSDPIVKLTGHKGHARLRLLVGAENAPATPPADKIIMELSVPKNVSVKVLKERDDPKLPIGFETTEAPEAASDLQIQCSLYVEVPPDLEETNLRILVEDQHHQYLTIGTIGPDGDDDDEGNLTLEFVVTLRKESPADEHQADTVSTNTSTWSRPDTSTWS